MSCVILFRNFSSWGAVNYWLSLVNIKLLTIKGINLIENVKLKRGFYLFLFVVFHFVCYLLRKICFSLCEQRLKSRKEHFPLPFLCRFPPTSSYCQ